MKKIIIYSALLISSSILCIGSMIIIEIPENSTNFFYNVSGFMFLISIFGIIILTFLLIKTLFEIDDL